MQIQLSPNAEAMLNSLTSDGSSPVDVVELAIVGLVHQQTGSLPVCFDPSSGKQLTDDDLKLAVQEGIDDLEAGRVRPLDIQETKRRARQRLAPDNAE